jgi:HK97 family phage portal protein
MGLLSRIFGRNEHRAAKPAQGWQPTPGWQPFDYLPPTVGNFGSNGRVDSGVHVDEQIALTASAVYACVSVISNTISSLPLAVKQKTGHAEQINHPVYKVLHERPNEFMTAPTFRETMMLNLLLWGACYAYIEKDELGNCIGLYPLRSAVTRPIRMFGQLMYLTQVGTTMAYLTPDQVFCVMNMSLDGITPLSPIQQAKQSVGLSLALERYAAKLFGNGGNLGGILTLPVGMKEDAVKNFVASWKKAYTGIDNSYKTAVLPAEYKYQQTGTTPENAQAVEARTYQTLEVCRIYRVPPHLVQDLSRGTFSNIEFQSQDFATNTISPWVIKWEAEANSKLFLEAEKPTLELRFNLDGLLRADLAARYASYMQGRQGGWLTVNEIRAKEGLPPIDGGDELLRPLNMAPVGNPPSGKPLLAPSPPKTDGDDSAPLGRSLLVDAATRILTKESKALARAGKKYQGKPDELRAWAEQWYTTHQPLVARVLNAPAKAAGIAIPIETYAADHCKTSVRAINAAADAGAGLDDLTDEWTDIRPIEIADSLLKGKP